MTVFSAFFGWAAPNLVCIRPSVVLAKSQILQCNFEDFLGPAFGNFILPSDDLRPMF
jgi:hypothetical protein